MNVFLLALLSRYHWKRFYFTRMKMRIQNKVKFGKELKKVCIWARFISIEICECIFQFCIAFHWNENCVCAWHMKCDKNVNALLNLCASSQLKTVLERQTQRSAASIKLRFVYYLFHVDQKHPELDQNAIWNNVYKFVYYFLFTKLKYAAFQWK